VSMMIKVHILFEFKEGPWGGGNQFLKSLKKYLLSIDAYDENVAAAAVILFNSHQCINKVVKAKLNYPEKIFIHRIDGPMRLYNKMSDKRDDVVFAANRYLADATVFQSSWSLQQNRLLGLPEHRFETVIVNAPEPTVFNRKGKIPFSTGRKVKLIATSWSSNWKKGFEVYQWLDKTLDFEKYEMMFVGRSPVQFRNIRHISPVDSAALAEYLKNSDIFIIASEKDPCSNTLIEALHCGLPAVALRDGGHPQILGTGGETFTLSEELPRLLDKITGNYRWYQKNISVPAIEQIGRQYYDFVEYVCLNKKKDKTLAIWDYLGVYKAIIGCKISERLSGLVRP
jgi:glycosyltransferase involved in cell wall biosynthesis